MALIVADRVKETTTTTGTGTLSLAGVVAGFQSFVAGVGTTNTTYYAITDSATGDWEVGIGTVTSGSPNTLSRDTVLESSNSDNLVNFGAGQKLVICTQPAEKAVYLDASDQLVIDGTSVTATAAELNYVDGVTSAIQTQLNAKAPINNATFTGTTAIPTADIDGGTIDGVTIGGASAGAGTFTTLAATTKSFLVDHPTKPDMKLRYACLEGPENGVYVRGCLTGSNVIKLPDYWLGLVHEDSITVSLTPVGRQQDLYVVGIHSNEVYVGGENVDCFYVVYGERKDVEKLVVEF